LDQHFKADMTQDQGIECAKKCIYELNHRFMISQHGYLGKLVTKDGIKEIKFGAGDKWIVDESSAGQVNGLRLSSGLLR